MISKMKTKDPFSKEPTDLLAIGMGNFHADTNIHMGITFNNSKQNHDNDEEKVS
jgi:hypothetical protein